MSLPTRATLAAALALLVTPALATAALVSEPIGTITGTLDGEAREWRTLDVAGGTGTATLQSFGPVTTISIQGHDPHGGSMMEGVLSIEIALMGSGSAAQPMDAPSVAYFPTGMRGPFYTADEEAGSAEIAFETLVLEGDARAAGTVSADLCRRDGTFADADEGDCIRLEAHFDTQLQRE